MTLWLSRYRCLSAILTSSKRKQEITPFCPAPHSKAPLAKANNEKWAGEGGVFSFYMLFILVWNNQTSYGSR